MRFVKPNIVFLDEDLMKSAQMLTNEFLSSNIKHCTQVLICAILYKVGIRNKNLHKGYFGKDRRRDTLEKFFPNYPLRNTPSFLLYNSREARWCRQCQNHYDVISKYLIELLDEYAFRFNKDHELYEMGNYLKMLPYHLSISLGLSVYYIENLKIILPWKNLPPKYRKKNIIEGYRLWYSDQIYDPIEKYADVKRDIPEFLIGKNRVDDLEVSLV